MAYKQFVATFLISFAYIDVNVIAIATRKWPHLYETRSLPQPRTLPAYHSLIRVSPNSTLPTKPPRYDDVFPPEYPDEYTPRPGLKDCSVNGTRACQNGGLCRWTNKGKRCLCTEEWTGAFCTQRLPPRKVNNTENPYDICQDRLNCKSNTLELRHRCHSLETEKRKFGLTHADILNNGLHLYTGFNPVHVGQLFPTVKVWALCRCKKGYVGPWCSTECPYGRYGQYCLKKCSEGCLRVRTCHPATGKCKPCKNHYTGANCETFMSHYNCTKKNEAVYCQGRGRCKKQRCQCVGYDGIHCEITCSKWNRWGTLCKHKCGSCRNPTCDHVSGRCQPSNSSLCIKPYVGLWCSSTSKLISYLQYRFRKNKAHKTSRTVRSLPNRTGTNAIAGNHFFWKRAVIESEEPPNQFDIREITRDTQAYMMVSNDLAQKLSHLVKEHVDEQGMLEKFNVTPDAKVNSLYVEASIVFPLAVTKKKDVQSLLSTTIRTNKKLLETTYLPGYIMASKSIMVSHETVVNSEEKSDASSVPAERLTFVLVVIGVIVATMICVVTVVKRRMDMNPRRMRKTTCPHRLVPGADWALGQKGHRPGKADQRKFWAGRRIQAPRQLIHYAKKSKKSQKN